MYKFKLKVTRDSKTIPPLDRMVINEHSMDGVSVVTTDMDTPIPYDADILISEDKQYLILNGSADINNYGLCITSLPLDDYESRVHLVCYAVSHKETLSSIFDKYGWEYEVIEN